MSSSIFIDKEKKKMSNILCINVYSCSRLKVESMGATIFEYLYRYLIFVRHK